MTTHGERYSLEYSSWHAMMSRCNNPHHTYFHRYGGRGIKVCKRWSSFVLFLRDMGRRPSPKHSIERIRNSRGYFPSNCRWATQREQCNNRLNNRLLTIGKVTLTVSQWAARFGMESEVFRQRIKRGWSIKRAVSQPIRVVRRAA